MAAMRKGALVALLAIAACNPATERGPGQVVTQVVAKAQTVASATGTVSAGAIVLAGDALRIVGATALGGLEVYDATGTRLSSTPAGEVAGVDIAYGYDMGGSSATIVAAVDITQNAWRLFQLKGEELTEVGARAVVHVDDFAGHITPAAVGVPGEREPRVRQLRVDRQVLFAHGQPHDATAGAWCCCAVG